jgi:hypothetical protein
VRHGGFTLYSLPVFFITRFKFSIGFGLQIVTRRPDAVNKRIGGCAILPFSRSMVKKNPFFMRAEPAFFAIARFIRQDNRLRSGVSQLSAGVSDNAADIFAGIGLQCDDSREKIVTSPLSGCCGSAAATANAKVS